MLEAVGYARVSGASQVDKDGFPRQMAAIKACCESKGMTLVHEYHEEAVPGKLDEEHRPAFQRMIADLLSNGCRTSVIESMQRLARAYRTQEHLIIYLASKGISLISADTGEDITAAMMGDPMRRALVQIQGIIAELEKNLIVTKLRAAKDRMRERGEKAEGRYAFGYHPEKPEEKLILSSILDRARHGDSAEKITVILNADKVPTRTGKGPWYPMVVRRILDRELNPSPNA